MCKHICSFYLLSHSLYEYTVLKLLITKQIKPKTILQGYIFQIDVCMFFVRFGVRCGSHVGAMLAFETDQKLPTSLPRRVLEASPRRLGGLLESRSAMGCPDSLQDASKTPLRRLKLTHHNL